MRFLSPILIATITTYSFSSPPEAKISCRFELINQNLTAGETPFQFLELRNDDNRTIYIRQNTIQIATRIYYKGIDSEFDVYGWPIGCGMWADPIQIQKIQPEILISIKPQESLKLFVQFRKTEKIGIARLATFVCLPSFYINNNQQLTPNSNSFDNSTVVEITSDNIKH